jgi:hypothetical protein
MSATSDYELILAFRDQSPSFTHGFTLGRIWQQMRMRTAPFSVTIETELREDAILLATMAGWIEEFIELDEHWLRVTFMPEPGRR